MSELTNGLCSNRATETITKSTSITPTDTTELSEEAVQKVELSKFENNMLELQKEIDKACEHNPEFDKALTFIENSISNWIDKVNAKNDLPRNTPKAPIFPTDICIKKIILPPFQLSSNEFSILLKYLNFKYIKGRRVGGSYFLIKKCLFSSKLHLSTKNLVYFSY